MIHDTRDDGAPDDVRYEGWREVVGLWIHFKCRADSICRLVGNRLREKSRMTLRFLAWETGRMDFPLTETRLTAGNPVWEKKISSSVWAM